MNLLSSSKSRLPVVSRILGVVLLVAGCGPQSPEETGSGQSGSNPREVASAPTGSVATAPVRDDADPANPLHRTDIPDLLKHRREEQLAGRDTIEAFHDFYFTDRFAETGILFRHRVVDDAGKYWKPVHYDHGSGLAVADVDGDGRLDIYFMSQLGGNGLYRNLGDGQFEDITAKAGVAMEDRVSVAPAFADIDNDGDPDLFVTTVRMGNVMFENQGDGRFEDISKSAGLDYVGHSSGAVFFDFDRDGRLDLFLTNIGNYTLDEKGRGGAYVGRSDAFHGQIYPERHENSILYRNLGGNRFQDVSEAMNLVCPGWSGDASICDLNQDGFPDLYVLNMQGDDFYYENQQGQRFVEKCAEYFPKTPWGAMGIKFFDFNQDGRMDLYLTDMHSDMTDVQSAEGKTDLGLDFETVKSESWCKIEWTEEFLLGSENNIFGNAFFQGQPGGQFMEISDAINAENYWPWGVSVADVNADGFEDVMVTGGMGVGYRYGINYFMLNEAGRGFRFSEFILNLEPRLNGQLDKTAYVLNCDGADRDHPQCEGMSGRVRVKESLSSRSSVMFDLDEDGDLDIVTNEQNDRPLVLISNLSDRKKISFLKITLEGTASNRDGIGSQVRVTAGGKTWLQVHDANSGYLGRSSMPLYFGLDAATAVDRIEIVWPSGQQQVLSEGIALNSRLTIKEPAR